MGICVSLCARQGIMPLMAVVYPAPPTAPPARPQQSASPVSPPTPSSPHNASPPATPATPPSTACVFDAATIAGPVWGSITVRVVMMGRICMRDGVWIRVLGGFTRTPPTSPAPHAPTPVFHASPPPSAPPVNLATSSPSPPTPASTPAPHHRSPSTAHVLIVPITAHHACNQQTSV